MSQFTGGRRVRCIDCLHLQGNQCIGRKNTPTVAPKKKRACGTYSFKGEYHNSTPLEAAYLPYIDPKTKKLMKKLMKLGAVPVPDKDLQEGGMRKIAMPASSATASLLGVEQSEDAMFYKVLNASDKEDEKDKDNLLWTPDSEDE